MAASITNNSPVLKFWQGLSRMEKEVLLLFSGFQVTVPPEALSAEAWGLLSAGLLPLPGNGFALLAINAFKKAISHGMMGPVELEGNSSPVQIHPGLSLHLRKLVNGKDSRFRQKLAKGLIHFHHASTEGLIRKSVNGHQSDKAAVAQIALNHQNILHVLFIALKTDEDIVPFFAALTSLYFEDNEIDECLWLSDRLLKILLELMADESKEPANFDIAFTSVLDAIARCYSLKRQLNDAKELLLQLLSFNGQGINETDFPTGQGEVYRMLGNVCRDLMQYEESYGYYRKALAVFEKYGDPQSCASVLQNLGRYFYDLGEYKKAEMHFLSANKIYKTHRLERAMGKIHQLLAGLYYQTGQHEKSKKHYLECLSIAENLEDRYMTAKAFQGLGILLSAKNKFEKSLVFYKKALVIFLKFPVEYGHDIAQLYYNMANDCYNLEWHADAKTYYLRALEIYKTIPDRLKQAEILQNLGNVCYCLNEMGESRERDYAALQIFVEYGKTQQIAEITHNAINLSDELHDVSILTQLTEYLASSMGIEKAKEMLGIALTIR